MPYEMDFLYYIFFLFYAVFKSKVRILGNFMMVGKKQFKHLSILKYSRALADAARTL
jgi:hypothetical protein